MASEFPGYRGGDMTPRLVPRVGSALALLAGLLSFACSNGTTPVTADSGARTTDGATLPEANFVLPPTEPRSDGPERNEVGPAIIRDAAVDVDPVGTFAGVWQYQSGMTVWECTGETPLPAPTKGYTVTLYRSKRAPLAFTGGNGCEYPVDVASPSEVGGRDG